MILYICCAVPKSRTQVSFVPCHGPYGLPYGAPALVCRLAALAGLVGLGTPPPAHLLHCSHALRR